MKLEFFDSHVHASSAAMGSFANVDAALARAHEAGVTELLAVSVAPREWPELARLAARTEADPPQHHNFSVFWAAGWHPWSLPGAHSLDPAAVSTALESALRESETRPVAFGECGLDRNKGGELSHQVAVLLGHFRPAREMEIPLVLHCAGFFDTLIALLDQQSLPPSIVHSYSGAPEIALELVKRGHYIGISGAVCDPKARRLHRTVAALPIDRLLIETDAPNQTPLSHRPSQNEPAFLPAIANAVAALRNVEVAEVAAATQINARRVLRLAEVRRLSGLRHP